jgi:hypothetical protein
MVDNPNDTDMADAAGESTDCALSLRTIPATTETSFESDKTHNYVYSADQNDRVSASSSAPQTPLDEVRFTEEAKTQGSGSHPSEQAQQQLLLEDQSQEPPLVWVQARPDVVVPTVVMTRIRKAPQKFRLLVRVLERERLAGNTRVKFSQLGALLRQESTTVYHRAGVAQLKEYVALAEQDGVVIVGRNADEAAWDNGNKWVALHPVYHGKPPEPQNSQQPYPPPPVMQPPPPPPPVFSPF